MTRSLKIAGIAALSVIALPALASAQTMAVATTDLNLRAGPSPDHAVIGVIPGHQQVVIHDCTASMNWCQVSYGATSGWSYTPYLATEGQVAVAGPQPGDPVATRGHGGAPVAGIAGGALAGGLIGGPPGAIIGGGLGAMATAPRAHAGHGHVAVAGPHPHGAPHHHRRHAGAPVATMAGGALAGGLIGGPPGAIIGAGAGGLLAAGAQR